MEERNVETVERWCRDVFEGDLDLLDDLFSYPYIRRFRRGTLTYEPAARRELVEDVMRNFPGLRWEVHDIVARDDRVGCRLTATWLPPGTGEREFHSTWLEVHRLEDGRIAETWQQSRGHDAGPWPGESVPRDQWSIASAESLTPDEEANLATLNRWGDIRHNRSDNFDALPGLVTDPFILHGPGATQPITAAEVVRNAAAFAERYPGFTASYGDLFVVGDRAVARFCYRFPEPSSERGSIQCGVAIYRFEDHRLAEYWQVNLPNDMDWD